MDGRKTISSTARYLTHTGASSVKGSIIPSGSVMVSCIGSDMGKSVVAGKDCVTNQQINSIVVNKKFDHGFVYYNLSMRKSELQHHASGGSTMPILNKGHFSELDITLPSLSEQRLISGFLSTLDDRITLLRETNTTLEAIAQALFKSWFVDFDPVRAKQEGREPEGMDADTAALFPDCFEESELELVPKGWKVRSIGDVACNHSSTFNFSKTDKVIFINTSDVSDGVFLHANYSLKDQLPGQAKKTIQNDDILFSEIRPKNRRFAYVNFDSKDYVVSTKFMILRVTGSMHPRYLYQILRQYETIEHFNIIAESRSGTFPQITFDSINKFKVVEPSQECMLKYIECISPIIKKIDLITQHQKLLETLRDTLLPRLISGQLRLPDAENILGNNGIKKEKLVPCIVVK